MGNNIGTLIMKIIYLLFFSLFTISVYGNEWSIESELIDSENPIEQTHRTTRGILPSPFYWEAGDNTKEFTIGKEDIYWIDEIHNLNLQNKPDVFFAYVLGKSDHTSALVRVHTIKDENGVVNSFTFDVIKGLIDKESIIDRTIDNILEYIPDSFSDVTNFLGNLTGDKENTENTENEDIYQDESRIDYITELLTPEQWGSNFAFKTNAETLPSNNNENFDNNKYKSYQDDFLLEETNGKKLADFLPSHLLYSPEDYIWDATRFKLVNVESIGENWKVGENEKIISYPYIDSTRNEKEGGEGTIEKIFTEVKNNAPDNRTPILFIHGWQGEDSNAFDILHEYSWTASLIKDSPTSGEGYWRNMLTYMYRDHYEDFKQFKPYIYHYPSYKHAKFNARMLKDLLDKIDDDVIRKGIENNQLIIISHSMGTIVSRSLMEEFGYLPHVKQFISLAGVHHGSPGSISSLIGSSVFIGKSLDTPGACDLMIDNYDGFINQSVIDDIHNNSTSKELLTQREACGSVIINEKRYDTEAGSFDLHYLNKLGVNEYYVEDRTTTIVDDIPIIGDLVDGTSYGNAAVPYHSNPWLLYLNKKHQEQYQASTRNKYYFYSGYVIATIAEKIDINNFKLFLPDPEVKWQDWLADDLAMDEIAAFSVAGQSDYNFLDSVVLLPHSIFDTSRGRLLKDGDLTTSYGIGYDKAEAMSSDLQLTPLVTAADLKAQPLFTGKNSWGANFRIFADYHHDRMLNGGYKKSYDYRSINTENNGSGHNDFYNYVSNEIPEPFHFKYDPLFEQIRNDIIGFSENVEEVAELTEYEDGFNEAIKRCKTDPASCEIISHCPEINTHALFSSDNGILTIPAVDIPNGAGGFVVYSGSMSLMPGENLIFSIVNSEMINTINFSGIVEEIVEENEYDTGFNEAKKQCQIDYTSCGIIHNCPKIDTHALFLPNDGTITIPAIDIPDDSDGFVVYRGSMSIVPGKDFVFSVTSAEPIQPPSPQ